MLKKYLKTMILTSIVILVPLLVGAFVLWDNMADMMIIHWGMDGQPDGFAGKAFGVFVPSLMMLVIHWLTALDTLYRNRKQSPKAKALVLWICPVMSLIIGFVMYFAAMGVELDPSRVIFLPMGILFTVMGNYMPKFRQNPTLGIKTSWALADEENWNATHRFGGKLWLGSGLALIFLSFLPFQWIPAVFIGMILAAGFLPILYSWQFYRKKKAAGVEVKAAPTPHFGKWAWLFTVAVLVILALILFTGRIDYTFGDDALSVTSNRMSGITVAYDKIDAVELREEQIPGTRTFGYGSFHLLLGMFSNEEFGNYTRYTYYKANPCIIITAGEKTLVLSGEDETATRQLYNTLLAKIG